MAAIRQLFRRLRDQSGAELIEMAIVTPILLMILAGIAMMTPAALQWIATRQITSHWAYFAAGGTLILTGLGLATWFVLLLILQELTTRDARARRDLSA